MSSPDLIVLIPYSQGVMTYHRDHGGELRPAEISPSWHAVFDFVSTFPPPRLVTVLDRQPSRCLMDLLLRETDLCIVPDCWAQHIPIWRASDRAYLAMQLTDAFLSEPIRLLGHKNTG